MRKRCLKAQSRARGFPKSRAVTVASLACLAALGFMSMPISVLAPLEVTPRDATIVAMPVEGIVQKIHVSPNDIVTPGQPLIQLIDTVSRNKLAISEREVGVAQAKLENTSSLSFTDPKGRHELGVARAELALRMAERDYARVLHDQMSLTAPSAGMVVFSDRKDIEGKPAAIGDRLMQIATPGLIELRIDLPVADSIVLNPGARVRAFLDSTPMNAVLGRVTQIDYQARLSDSNVAIYRVFAVLDDGQGAPPRFGTRGTAQIDGPQGTLALFLFRRPLSALRQRLGL